MSQESQPTGPRTPVDRIITTEIREADAVGAPLSRRSTQRQRSLEAYLKAGVRPRWMERLVDIDSGIEAERRRLARAHRALLERCGSDRGRFAAEWRERARSWRFDDLNELIAQHNAWYPVERDLPMDPRTGDYVLIGGRTYRRTELDAGWILEQFPAEPA